LPSAVGPTNGTGARPDGVIPSVDVSAGGVVSTYGFWPTGWVAMTGAGDPSA